MNGGATPDGAACPTCGEPVGAISGYCLNCEEALDDDGATVETAVVDFGGDEATSDAAAETSDETADDEDDGAEGSTSPGISGPPDDLVWFHVDSLKSSGPVVMSGIAAGTVVGGGLREVLTVVTSGAVALLLGVVAGGATCLYAIRAQSVYGGVRRAALLLGVLVVAAPAFLVIGIVDDLETRVLLFTVTELVAVPVALKVRKFGRWIGAKAPD